MKKKNRKKLIIIVAAVLLFLIISVIPIETENYHEGDLTVRAYTALTYKRVEWQSFSGYSSCGSVELYLFPYNFMTFKELKEKDCDFIQLKDFIIEV